MKNTPSLHTYQLALDTTSDSIVHVCVYECIGSVGCAHLIGLSPNMAPLYWRAMGTESGEANSTKANLIGREGERERERERGREGEERGEGGDGNGYERRRGEESGRGEGRMEPEMREEGPV